MSVMPSYAFETVDVFTDQRFGGNPLAVFKDARGLSAEEMQKLAFEFNLSETTFVLPPEAAENTAGSHFQSHSGNGVRGPPEHWHRVWDGALGLGAGRSHATGSAGGNSCCRA